MSQLPLYHRSRVEAITFASVDEKWLLLLQQLGRWHVVNRYDEVVQPPRCIRHVVDTDTGKPFQLNLSLHRVVIALELSDDPQELVKLDNLELLWITHQKLPRIRIKDGDYHNCTLDNLETMMSEKTQIRRLRAGKSINMPVPRADDGSAVEVVKFNKLPVLTPRGMAGVNQAVSAELETERMEKAVGIPRPKKLSQILDLMNIEPSKTLTQIENGEIPDEYKAQPTKQHRGDGAINNLSSEGNVIPEADSDEPILPKE